MISKAVLDARGRLLYSTNAQTRIAPGSAVKPLIATALLDARASAPVLCSGRLVIEGRNLSCAHPRPSGPVTLHDAIAYSCNQYFATAAMRLKPEQVTDRLRRFGLNTALPSSPEKQMLQAVGEWGVECSSAELAAGYLRLSTLRYPMISEALRTAAMIGTARLAGSDVCGKTGTSPNRARTGTWAIFAGWSPATAPNVFIAVFAPGGSGATQAAPLARELFQKFRR